MSDSQTLDREKALGVLLGLGEIPEDWGLEELLAKDKEGKKAGKIAWEQAMATRVRELLQGSVKPADAPGWLERLNLQSLPVQRVIVEALRDDEALTVEVLVESKGSLSQFHDVRRALEEVACLLVQQADWGTALRIASLSRDVFNVRSDAQKRLAQLVPEATLDQLRMLSDQHISGYLSIPIILARAEQLAAEIETETLKAWLGSGSEVEVNAGVSTLVKRGELTLREMVAQMEEEMTLGADDRSLLFSAYKRGVGRLIPLQETTALVEWLEKGFSLYDVTGELMLRAREERMTPAVALRVAQARSCYASPRWPDAFVRKVGSALQGLSLAQLIAVGEKAHSELTELIIKELRQEKRMAELRRIAQEGSPEPEAAEA